ncbi:4-(cytidine 5'-diphospho)-2-C-methyl-D-erythritol kinase [uncultured Imperialibacter sp.]|uniref:4-(cytidine 5'-diphospho)-2-C-methyl-D-erythritol kinase n=1 Tax=uncultured Imperialibacter sp. TaxID=1672639 RepID=UPI0030D6DF38
MITFPNAKINLGLQILRKRPDGYHDISSLFLPIPLQDVLEIVEAKSLSFTSSGLPIPGSSDDNLCLKAYHLLKKDFELPPISIHLYKAIPMGAGLGGGSADGAFMLVMLNEKFGLGLSNTQLEDYAAQLGSDCPFFVKNEAAIASGRGTELSSFPVNLKGNYLLLVFPGIHIGTREAYAGVKPNDQQKTITEILSVPVSSWKDMLINDFEQSVFPNHPSLGEIKEKLYADGAVYASMTGSGSTMYGIFEGKPKLKLANEMNSWATML